MGFSLKRTLAAAVFIASGLNYYFWEFVRSKIYERLWEMVEPTLQPHWDLVARAGITTALFAAGAALLWHTRPTSLAVQPDGSAAAGFVGAVRRQRRDKRQRFRGYEIWKLADQEVIDRAGQDEKTLREVQKEVAEIDEKMRELSRQRPSFKAGAIIEPPTEAMEALQRAASELYVRKSAAERALGRIKVIIMDNVHQKLRSGKLVARGFHHPVGLNPQQVEIPSEQWHLLSFGTGYVEAEGQGLKYVGLELAKA
jgi:hypothetical protein